MAAPVTQSTTPVSPAPRVFTRLRPGIRPRTGPSPDAWAKSHPVVGHFPARHCGAPSGSMSSAPPIPRARSSENALARASKAPSPTSVSLLSARMRSPAARAAPRFTARLKPMLPSVSTTMIPESRFLTASAVPSDEASSTTITSYDAVPPRSSEARHRSVSSRVSWVGITTESVGIAMVDDRESSTEVCRGRPSRPPLRFFDPGAMRSGRRTGASGPPEQVQ